MQTPRERLLAALHGQPTDRVPVWLLFPYHPTAYYVDVRQHPAYQPIDEMARQMAVTLNRRNLHLPLHAPSVQRESSTEAGPDGPVTVTRLRGGGGTLVERRWPDGRVEHLLDRDEALEIYCDLALEEDPKCLTEALDAQLPAYLAEKAEFPVERGAMMLDLGEPVADLYYAADLCALAIWSLTHEARIAAFLDRAMARKRVLYTYCLERDLADVYFLVGSELTAPPLVGLEAFRRWIVPYAKELIDLVHSYGKTVIQHFHGQILELLPEFVEMGADALHTIEAPPIGNCTLPQAYETVGDTMTLIGNIQYDDFRAFTPGQMREAVNETLASTAGRRFILSPTAGPFDPDVSSPVIENYRVFLETAWAWGSG